MLIAVDHLVVLVHDLHAACRAYEGLGFAVTPGGEHPVGTHNALIPFADGAYIELIAFKEPAQSHDHPWWPFLATGGGLVDVALLSDDLDGELARAAAHGLHFAVHDGRRRRPDGQELGWRAARPTALTAVPLPFLIQDVTPRALRVPEDHARQHRNGVRGIAAVYVAVADLPAAGRAYAALLGGREAESTLDERLGAAGLELRCGAARIVLLPYAAVRDRLPEAAQRRGPGVCAAALTGPPIARGMLDVVAAQGALLFVDEAE